MSGTSRGFSFIELVVVIAIIGVMTAMIIPRLFQQPVSPLEAFATELSALVQAGVVEAVRTGHVHRVMFDFNAGKVMLEVARKKDSDPTAAGAAFDPTFSAIAATSIALPVDDRNVPPTIVRHFFLDKEDLLTGGKSKTAWFFIGPDGTVQDVSIVLQDAESDYTVSLVTNPFTGSLVMYDGIKKP